MYYLYNNVLFIWNCILRIFVINTYLIGIFDMGKGDKRTKRGKIWRGTYGKTRLKPNKMKKKEEQKQAETSETS